MPIPASDIDFILRDTGVPVRAGSIQGLGIFDRPDKIIQDGYVQTAEYELLCRSDLFGKLPYGSGIVVDGTQYIVRENRDTGDGSFCKILLESYEGDQGDILPVIEEEVILDGGHASSFGDGNTDPFPIIVPEQNLDGGTP